MTGPCIGAAASSLGPQPSALSPAGVGSCTGANHCPQPPPGAGGGGGGGGIWGPKTGFETLFILGFLFDFTIVSDNMLQDHRSQMNPLGGVLASKMGCSRTCTLI